MSREVRRVPLDWEHPTEPNPYWREQIARRLARGEDLPKLHAPESRFVGLFDDYPGALTSWEQEGTGLRGRTGSSWAFRVEYHLTGYQGHEDTEPVVHPFYEDETPVEVRDEDHLHTLVLAEHERERPDPAHYMPVFDGPADGLGWCLYETVSEGTPVTPAFATADALVEHLATVGTEWGGPLRRESAEVIVRRGFTLGSLIVAGGQVLNSTDDADKVAALTLGGAA